MRLKHVATIQTGIAKGKDYTGIDTVNVPYLRVANVQDGYFNLEDVATIEVPVTDVERYRLRPGDVLMNEGGDNDKLGRGHIWTGEVDPCVHQNHVFAVRPHRVSSAWLNTVTGCDYAQFFFLGRAKQSTNLASISSTNLMELPVVMPPPEEQEDITNFLARETAKIDALVAEQERLIDLLSEKRQAVISHAVTKGLDPEVEMKDSGTTWLGKVPAHWQMTYLKYATDQERPIMYGIVLPGPHVEFGIPIVKGGDVKPGRLTLESLCRTTHEIERGYERSRLIGGDILISIRGTVGEIEMVPEEISGANITQDVARIAASGEVDSVWLSFVLRARAVVDPMLSLSLGAAVRGINIRDLKRLKLPLPPRLEQEAIATHLLASCEVFDSMAHEAERAISLLHEHRAALISAAVSGKIDVRVCAVILT